MSSPLNASTYEMNVSMVEHQRSILAALGIDVWMPRVDAQTCTYTSSLYRDQAAPEQNTLHDFQLDHSLDQTSVQGLSDALKNSSAEDQRSQLTALEQQNAQTLNLRQNDEQGADQSSVAQKAHGQAKDQPQHLIQNIVEQREATYVAPFELQALNLERCVILVDSTALTEQQASLWQNIQMAKVGQFSTLKWPFALAPLQDGRGAQVYVQGFIDALKVDKQVLSLGRIEHSRSVQMIELASLQEMLEQPQLKRKLWAYM